MGKKRGEAFDRFDSHGVISHRAWLYSEDQDGNVIKPIPPGFDGIRCRETRAYAPAPEAGGKDEQAERTGRLENAIASLTAEERAVLRLQGKVRERVGHRILIASGDLVQFQREGYTMIPGTAQMVERPNLPAIECIEIFGWQLVEVEPLDYAGIAEQLELTVSQVHSRIKSANKKLRRGAR